MNFLTQNYTDLRGNNLFFLLKISDWRIFIEKKLSPELLYTGFPVFFIQKTSDKQYNDLVSQLIEYIEILYYRHCIYPVEGHSNQRGLPLRPLKRVLFFDQQKHAYENLVDYIRYPGIEIAKNKFKGGNVICIGAGPVLEQQIDYIKANVNNALLICVNSALPALLRHNIEPDFVIINDSSLATEQTFRKLHSQLPETIIVPHVFSYAGGNLFQYKLFFDNYYPYIFGFRDTLQFHGSVITTAFSFAVYLGCSTIVFAGTQLLSENPYYFTYHSATQNYKHIQPDKINLNLRPNMYQVKNASMELKYTTLNMLDAALWLKNRIYEFKQACHDSVVINLSANSLLYGKDIIIDNNYILPDYHKSVPMKLLSIIISLPYNNELADKLITTES
jgi:hypothetical protein